MAILSKGKVYKTKKAANPGRLTAYSFNISSGK